MRSAYVTYMRRLHLAYIWHSDHEAWATQLSMLHADDLIVFNPSSGPTPDDSLELSLTGQHIETARGHKAIPFGYVDYGYGKRPIGDVLADLRTWWACYRINRIFFDQMPATATIHALASLRYLCYLASVDEIAVIFNFGTKPTALTLPRQSLAITYEGPADGAPTAPRIYAPWEAWIRYNANGPAQPGPQVQAWTADRMPNPYDGR